MPFNNHNGNWVINLSLVLCNSNIIISEICNINNYDSNQQNILDSDDNLPANWPNQWNDGRIPFTFNFYSMSRNRKRLIKLVNVAHSYIENRSCLIFEEHDPQKICKEKNFTYIYYVFTAALENCCLNFFWNRTGRRVVLITPSCNMPIEIAHATLHGLGANHNKDEGFNNFAVKSILFPNNCEGIKNKIV